MANPKRKKGKIKFRQTYALVGTTRKNNASNVGHPVLLNNAARVRIKMKPKS